MPASKSGARKARRCNKMRTDKKSRLATLRHWRIRKKISGTKERPRMSVRFSNQHIFVQFIDDVKRVTLASTSTLRKKEEAAEKLAANAASAKKIGALAAQAAKSKGITRVVFDRSGARYHGKVKALADAAREGGLQF
jgi:large subunit ribosomal protein L18